MEKIMAGDEPTPDDYGPNDDDRTDPYEWPSAVAEPAQDKDDRGKAAPLLRTAERYEPALLPCTAESYEEIQNNRAGPYGGLSTDINRPSVYRKGIYGERLWSVYRSRGARSQHN